MRVVAGNIWVVGWRGSGICVGCQVSCGVRSVYLVCVCVVKVCHVCSVCVLYL